MTVLTSGIAMAAYVCPQLAPAPVQKMAMEGMPCAEMDKEKPVHCAEAQSGDQLALEHVATPPVPTPVFAAFIMPVPAPAILVVFAPVQGDVPLQTGADPPYLQTLRLRI